MTRLFALVAVLGLALGLLPAAQAQPDAPGLGSAGPLGRSGFMGMVIRDPWYEFGTHPGYPNQPNYPFLDRMGATLAHAGVEWVRLDFHIPVPIGANHEQALVAAEIEKYNYFIETVAPRHGFRVLALLSFSMIPNDMYGLNSETAVPSRYGGGVNQYMNTFLSRALMIADRYGTLIHAYELLNEQNRLPPKGDAIAPNMLGRLITKFYRFCHDIDTPADEPDHRCRHAQVILGGLHPRGTSDAKGQIVVTDSQYLSAVYSDATSFAGFKQQHGRYPVDGIAYHPYPEEIRLSINDAYVDKGIDRMRQVVQAFDPGKQFWITEVGYNEAYGQNSPVGQAPFLRDVYTSLAARTIPGTNTPEVANVFWFKYEDFPPSEGKDAQKWGVVRIPFVDAPTIPGGARYDPNGVPAIYRASFLAYRELAGLPIQRTFLPAVGR